MTEIDLFEDYESLPVELRDICERYSDIEAHDGFGYKECGELLADVEKLGYTFEYGLDAVPFNLQKIVK